MSKQVLFVTGALNAEMVMIKKVLKAAGMPYTAATKDGKYSKGVKAAYQADGVMNKPKDGQKVCFIRCEVKDLEPIRVFEPLSRNEELDLGSPEFFWGSSAIGQLVSALISDATFGGGRETAKKLAPLLWEARLAAASEHYLSEAYAGQCPGVDPVAIRLWRAMNRSEFMSKSPRELMDDADQAVAIIQQSKLQDLGSGRSIIDVNGSVPEILEAAAMLGKPIMYTRPEKGDKGDKVTVLNGTPDILDSWIRWAKSDASKLTDVYGSSDKGYAGGFLKK
jgi:hypothetical protein